MSKFLRIVLLFLTVFLLVGCDEEIALELDTPTNVVVNNGIVTWTAVPDATEYVVVVGTNSYTVTTTTFDLNTLNLAGGTYTIHVVARAGTEVSLPSSTVNYVQISVNFDALYTQILALIDPSFEPDMVEEDFEDEWEYSNYSRMSALANTYAQTAIELNMAEEDAVEMFTYVKTMPDRMETVEGVYDMQDEIDSFFAFEMTSEEMATMIVELALVGIEIAIEDMEANSLNRATELALLINQVNAYTLDTNAMTVYNELAFYASPEELVLLDSFFDGEYDDTYYVIWQINSIAYELTYNYEFHNPDEYLMSYDPYIVLFYNLLLEAKIADDMTAHQLFMMGNPLQSLENLVQMKNSIMYYTEDIARDEENLLNLAELLAFITLEKQMVLDSVEGVIEYVTLVYDTIPATVFTLLDDMSTTGELTMEEYFLLKNEIVNVLQTTLPSIEDFENMYTMLFHIAQIMGDVDLTELMGYANFFAQVEHASIDLALTLVADIDQLMIEDIMVITDGMVIPGEIVYDEYYEEWYQQSDTVDFPKVIELAVYVGTYIQDFIDANQVKVQTLETLLNSSSVEELFGIAAENLLTVLESEMEPDEFEMVELMVNELVADYDNIKAGLDVIKETGIIMIDQFLVTEGQLFLDIYDLVNMGSGDFTDPLFVADLESVFALVVEYNSLLMGEVTPANIETLLRAIRVPLKYAMVANSTEVTYAEFDALFTAIVSDVATVIGNISTIEQQIMNSLDALNVSTLLFSSSWNLDPQFNMFGILVLALDQAMTTTYENLFFATLVILSDEIMKNPTVLDLTGMLVTDIDQMFDMLEDHYTLLFLDIHQVADYNFTTLTQLQVDELLSIFERVVPQMGPEDPQPIVN